MAEEVIIDFVKDFHLWNITHQARIHLITVWCTEHCGNDWRITFESDASRNTRLETTSLRNLPQRIHVFFTNPSDAVHFQLTQPWDISGNELASAITEVKIQKAELARQRMKMLHDPKIRKFSKSTS